MVTIDMNRYEGPFVYLVLFDCPNCGKLVIARGGELVAQKEEEMRNRGFRVKCECGFDGFLLGTAWKGLVELDFSEWRQAAGVSH